jgi:hypothetical protein
MQLLTYAFVGYCRVQLHGPALPDATAGVIATLNNPDGGKYVLAYCISTRSKQRLFFSRFLCNFFPLFTVHGVCVGRLAR